MLDRWFSLCYLYVAAVWGTATKYYTVTKALRTCRTVSAAAAIALTKFTPLHLAIDGAREVQRVKLSSTQHSIPEDITLRLRELTDACKLVRVEDGSAAVIFLAPGKNPLCSNKKFCQMSSVIISELTAIETGLNWLLKTKNKQKPSCNWQLVLYDGPTRSIHHLVHIEWI